MEAIETIDWTSERYHALYRRSRVRTVFAHPDFLSALAYTFGLTAKSNLAATPDVEAAVVTWYRSVGPIGRFTHPAVSYYSAAIASTPCPDLPHIFARLGTASGARRVQLSPLPSPPGEDLDARRFVTYRLETSELEPSNWSASRRRLFVKNREQYLVQPASPEMVADWSCQAYEQSGRRPPFDRQRLVSLVTQLSSCGLAELHRVESDSGVQGAVAILVDDDRGYYWLAGSEPGAAMTVLLGHVFEGLVERGLGFDFLGANTPSIAEFKRRFGGSLVEHFHLHPERGSFLRRRIFGRR